MNVYSDDQNTMIFHIAGKSGSLPSFVYMGGDFNCHSSVWDPKESSHRMVPIALLESAADLGLELAMPDNLGPMLYLYNRDFRPLVIDLIFLQSQDVLARMPHREIGIQGSSDHILISAVVPLSEPINVGTTQSIKPNSEAERDYVDALRVGLAGIPRGDLDTADEIDATTNAVVSVFKQCWDTYSESKQILFEKMLSNRLQFDMICHDLVHPNQMGGVRQRSTEDAGIFLTHLVPAHDCCDLPPIRGRNFETSLDSLRKNATNRARDSWIDIFQDLKYRGSNFLMLQELDGTPIQPSYINGGAWLPLFKHSTMSTARMNWLDAATAPPMLGVANIFWNGATNESTTLRTTSASQRI
ncbi:hypothetical protein BDN70DRAFT_939158 [Pholiota conissans]|uniref:Endonuclease/exonuclease/phosphatase domain-containing protein n=1 Tax=Pholiota conissans TaxID=109636 RepID=A0A9P6CRH5_9AGAR|nr:hypothetical protein BDN70DRAFT_939158 [Pholiota conissans]